MQRPLLILHVPKARPYILEIEFLEGEGGDFLDFGDKALEMIRCHVSLEVGFVLPCLIDHEAVGVGERSEQVVFHASLVVKRQSHKFFRQFDGFLPVFISFGNETSVQSYHNGCSLYL